MPIDCAVQLDLFEGEQRRFRGAHVWPKEPLGSYVEPGWCSERLFAAETFSGSVWDPASGIGRIPDAARRAGYTTAASDLIDRGYPHLNWTLNFLQCERLRGDNIVTNPPFQTCNSFIQHALKLDPAAIAMLWPARRLNAARWLVETPLARIHLLTPRPSMPPGHVIAAGGKPRGGTQDFRWLVWRRGHIGPPELRWLHRDGGAS